MIETNSNARLFELESLRSENCGKSAAFVGPRVRQAPGSQVDRRYTYFLRE